MLDNLAVLLTLVILTLWLAIFVYSNNPTRWVNRTFAIFSLAVAGWTAGTWLANYFAESEIALLAARVAFPMAALSVYSLLIFFHVFPHVPYFPRSKVVIAFGVLAATLAIIPTTPWIVTGHTMTDKGLKVQYGPLYPVFALYILSCVGYALWIIISKIRTAQGVEYLFAGLIVPGVLATVTNLLIPLAFGTSRFSQYGPLFSFLMVAMIAHAIIRHRLMDIRVVIRKSVVYVVAFVVAGTILTGLIVSSNRLFPESDWGLSREILLGLLVAVLFHPLKSRIQHAFDRYLYRGSYDYQRTIREASRVMTTMLDLGALLDHVSGVIGRTVRPELFTVYLRDRGGEGYRRTLSQSFVEGRPVEEPETIASDSSLSTLMQRERGHLLRDDLRRGDLDPETRAALEELGTLNVDLALPLVKEDQLTGFLLVGAKRSGDPYFSEDLDLLSTLASQAAIAVTNAQLYAEVVLVNEYVENILKTMESGVIAVSVEGKVTLFNSAAGRMAGLEAASLRAGPVERLPGTLADLIQATLGDGVPRLQVERTLAGADRRVTPVVCSTSPFSDARGRILGAVLVFSDLTRLKELEDERRRAARLASFQSLASGIAHEIKNPLVAIRAFAQLLPRKFGDEDFRENFSRVAVREIDRINDLVERLRVLSTPSKPLQPLDLRGPIEETLELLRVRLEDRRISVERIYDEHLPATLGEPSQLKQLFLNLFLNSLEAMEPGGTLSIRLKGRAGGDDSGLLVEIADTGCGIPEGLSEKVFDAFFSTKPQGTGIGLAICRGIADLHRATIHMENNSTGGGAVISLAFPEAVEMPAEVRG
ncbi:MAG: PAS domain-containing protein [Candidatus Rokubacteria bacterium]|nr:PAS domain-containing protein [Candidatus Rokubacteria bacterium]